MGKVRQPHRSGVLTISLVIFLHKPQTEAQATTSLRPGHEVSLHSTRPIMLCSNSMGKLAHGLLCSSSRKSHNESDPPSGAI
uniref:Tubby-like F-box protein 5 isoform X1 n=1 Tax=Rhizophora mucronata TaxID=61149 RepID=A0A2P2JYR7_RHIMU